MHKPRSFIGPANAAMAVYSMPPPPPPGSVSAGRSPAVLSGVACAGNENSLSQCAAAPTVNQCSMNAAIRCREFRCQE